jgi:hypothetical protein
MSSKIITTDDGTTMTISEMLKSIERYEIYLNKLVLNSFILLT